jgi:poly(3-hydroxybutyrate) depolymerase
LVSAATPRKGFLHRLIRFRGNQGGEDVTFFDNLVKTVEADLCVETTLRFSTGFSYGGAMSFAIAVCIPFSLSRDMPRSSSSSRGPRRNKASSPI